MFELILESTPYERAKAMLLFQSEPIVVEPDAMATVFRYHERTNRCALPDEGEIVCHATPCVLVRSYSGQRERFNFCTE